MKNIIHTKTVQGWYMSLMLAWNAMTLSAAEAFNKMQKSSGLNHVYSRLYKMFVLSVFFTLFCTCGEENFGEIYFFKD